MKIKLFELKKLINRYLRENSPDSQSDQEQSDQEKTTNTFSDDYFKTKFRGPKDEVYVDAVDDMIKELEEKGYTISRSGIETKGGLKNAKVAFKYTYLPDFMVRARFDLYETERGKLANIGPGEAYWAKKGNGNTDSEKWAQYVLPSLAFIGKIPAIVKEFISKFNFKRQAIENILEKIDEKDQKKYEAIYYPEDNKNIKISKSDRKKALSLLKKEIKDIKYQLSKNRKKVYEMMSSVENRDALESIAQHVDGTYGIPNFSKNKGHYKELFDIYEKNYKELLRIYKGLGPMGTISQLKKATNDKKFYIEATPLWIAIQNKRLESGAASHSTGLSVDFTNPATNAEWHKEKNTIENIAKTYGLKIHSTNSKEGGHIHVDFKPIKPI